MTTAHTTLAYVLHSRPYRETSLLIDLFTHAHGVVTSIVRGAKRGKQRTGVLLQPFQPLLLTGEVKNEWFNIKQVDTAGLSWQLNGERLFSGFYLNELLLRALERYDPHDQLFEIYLRTLEQLAGAMPLSPLLRSFEKHLLSELGYALPSEDMLTGEGWYRIGMHTDIVPASPFETGAIRGKSLIALLTDTWVDPQMLKEMKHFLQQLLSGILGHRPLKTRQWLQKLYNQPHLGDICLKDEGRA